MEKIWVVNSLYPFSLRGEAFYLPLGFFGAISQSAREKGRAVLRRLVTNEGIHFPEQALWLAICLTSSRQTQCRRYLPDCDGLL